MGASASTILANNQRLLETQNLKKKLQLEKLPRDLQVFLNLSSTVDAELQRRATAQSTLGQLRTDLQSILTTKTNTSQSFSSISELRAALEEADLALGIYGEDRNMEGESLKRFNQLTECVAQLTTLNAKYVEISESIKTIEVEAKDASVNWDQSSGLITLEEILKIIEGKADVCLLHDSNNKKDDLLVRKIVDSLREHGIRSHTVPGPAAPPLSSPSSINSIIANPVNNTKAAIVFISKSYMERVDSSRFKKDPCQLSFSYAYQCFFPDKILVVVTDEKMRNSSISSPGAPASLQGCWKGPIAALGNSLYLDFSDDSFYNNTFSCILDQLMSKIGQSVESFLTSIDWDGLVGE